MSSKHDASKEKIFWHEGNFGEWIAFMENYINHCVANKCSFMVYRTPIEKNLNQDIDLCIPNLRTRIMNLAINRYRTLYYTLRDFSEINTIVWIILMLYTTHSEIINEYS